MAMTIIDGYVMSPVPRRLPTRGGTGGVTKSHAAHLFPLPFPPFPFYLFIFLTISTLFSISLSFFFF